MMKKIIAVLLILALSLFCFCSCTYVQQETTIVLNNTSLTMNVGDSSILVASTNGDSGSLIWSSTNARIATVDDGTVTAVGEGSAVITVMSTNGAKASCSVTVGSESISSLSIDQGPSTMKEGETIKLDVIVVPSSAEDDLEWSSSNESVAVVDSSGNVTAIKAGVVNIKCAAPNGKKASCTITVKRDVYSSNNDNSSKTTIIYTPRQIGELYSSEFVFYDSSYRKLNDYEVSSLSSTEIQKAINEIYARNGYVFQTESIREYYEATTWYVPDTDFSTSDFNSVEKYNIALLQKYK